MTALERMNAYLRKLELRFRLLLATRGAAITGAGVLLLTLLLVWIANWYEFAASVVLPFRWLLYLFLAAAVAGLLIIPVLRFTRRRATRIAEARVPGFEQRLLTVAERPDASNPLVEVLADREHGEAVALAGLPQRADQARDPARAGGVVEREVKGGVG